MALRAPAIVGRAKEQAQLERIVGGVSSERVKLAEVTGPAGIGKTTLLDCLAVLARSRGIRCCRATATPAEQDRPFGVVVSLFDALLSFGDSRVDPMGSLGRDEFGDLAAALPSLRRSVSLGAAGRADPLLVARALRATLAAGAKGAGRAGGSVNVMAVLVDDIQWVDEASAAVLANLIRNGAGVPLMVGLTRRTGLDIPPALEASNVHPIRPIMINPGPLNREDSFELVRNLAPEQRESVVDLAGGNPFFLRELAAAARMGELVLPRPREHGRGMSYPAGVVASIEIELAALTIPARDLARAASVLGDPFETSFVGELAGLDSADTAMAIDELVDVGMVVECDNPGLFRFGHPIVGSVIHDTSGPGWRRHAHERAYRLLLRVDADQVRAAGHLERSAPPGDPAAAEALAAAAAVARALAPATAARLFASAIRVLPPSEGEADRRAMWGGFRADALVAAGLVGRARAELEQTLAAGEPMSSLSRAALVAHLARAQLWLGLDAEAEEHLESALSSLAPEPTMERLILGCLAMMTAAANGHVDRVRAVGSDLGALVASTDSPLARFLVAACRAMARATIGPGSAARSHVQQAAEFLDTLSETERAVACEAVSVLSTAELWLGLAPDALTHAELAGVVALESRNRVAELLLKMNGAAALVALGRLDEAGRTQREAEELARLVGQPNAVCPAVALRSTVDYLRGDLRRAEEAIDECLSLLPLVGGRTSRTVSVAFMARPLISVGRPEVARRLLLEHGGGPELTRLAHAVRSQGFEALVDVALAEDDADGARRWLRRAVSASDPDLPVTMFAARMATATLDLVDGRYHEAAKAAEGAAVEADRVGQPVGVARAHLLAGRARGRMGDRDEAVAVLEKAYGGFREAGAIGLAAETASELRGLGVRARFRRIAPETDTMDRTGVLSARELEIAELVAEGMGNQELARQLFLSPRTIESHLSRIFRKLGVHSRHEVGQAVRERQYRSAMRTEVD